MNRECCPSTVRFISIHASCTGRDGTTGNTTVTLRLKNNTTSSYKSEEPEYYTQRSLTHHYIKQRKADMLLDIARLTNGLRGLEPNNVSQLFLMLSQAADWEPQATCRCRSRRRNHHYLSNLLGCRKISTKQD